ncbi:hypothetical protein CHH28_04930 [Bacterioplanes sanyensis]|uniref:DUF2782 domain-containing protein n=1 Tax=Bacterioplanes sanyensis TaxID=1249553 RepID=A0A222FG60_9GAMM|nr:DUF2782 domain-containing protein [Bacterioplanes sanyensis]ASP38065.1 hypothetical protein CHH28_04930 [Bacterioplanes sanyensis]
MKHFIRLITLAALLPLTAVADPTDETVVIRHDGDQTFYEFRVNGEITEIKVVPKVGKPYYLVPDQTVDGDFVRRDNPEIVVPKWVIFRW